jgi:outer membrane protein TolC
MDVQHLVAEALENNPEIAAAAYDMDVMKSKAPQVSTLEPPTLTYTREDMPGFNIGDAMFSRLGIDQAVRLPFKLSTEGALANILAEHAHHDHEEVIFEVLEKLKTGYFELWFVQQSIILNHENIVLIERTAAAARSRVGAGLSPQQEAMSAQVQLAKLRNDEIDLRQQELSAKSMLMSILNRKGDDTLGYAGILDTILFVPTLDTVEELAAANRPMLIHDSLGVEESRTRLTLAKQEYLPDLHFGVEYVTEPNDDFRGWSFHAGITLPFAPWTLGAAGGRTDEANAEINRDQAKFQASRNMVFANIRDLYEKISAARRQLENYRNVILPQARQSLEATMTGYETGQIEFSMLLDSYTMLTDMTKDYYMTRMKFEQAIASLEREAGYENIAYVGM